MSVAGTNITLVRGLGLLAATALVVGDVIGTGVFLKARVMTCNVGTPGMVVMVWVVGGLLSLAGALTYAELAVLMPHAGGEYVFIREAYGRLWGFLYGWTRFFVASTGGWGCAGFAIFLNIASGGTLQAHAVRAACPDFRSRSGFRSSPRRDPAGDARELRSRRGRGRIAFAMASLKVALVLGVGMGAFLLADGDWANYAMSAIGGACEGVPAAARGGIAGFGAAMLGAMWAYNGWNEVPYVAGAVKDPSRNLPRAIIGGIGIISTLYVFANIAYFYVLPPAAVASVSPDSAVATEVVTGSSGVVRAASWQPRWRCRSSARCRSCLLSARGFRMRWRSTASFSPAWRVSARARACRFGRCWPRARGASCWSFPARTTRSRTTRSSPS
jgi:APA family basic amino acid/polyamine antiporter